MVREDGGDDHRIVRLCVHMRKDTPSNGVYHISAPNVILAFDQLPCKKSSETIGDFVRAQMITHIVVATRSQY